MKTFRTIEIAFFLLLWSLPAWAANGSCVSIQGENIKSGLVALFSEMAGKLGLSCPAFFKQTGEDSYLMEYLAPGQTAENWTELLAVALVETGPNGEADVTPNMLRDFVSFVKKGGGKAGVVSKKIAKDGLGRNRVWFAVAYEMGNPPFREKSVAVIRTVGAKYVANVQYRARKKVSSGHDLSHFLRLNGMEK